MSLRPIETAPGGVDAGFAVGEGPAGEGVDQVPPRPVGVLGWFVEPDPVVVVKNVVAIADRFARPAVDTRTHELDRIPGRFGPVSEEVVGYCQRPDCTATQQGLKPPRTEIRQVDPDCV